MQHSATLSAKLDGRRVEALYMVATGLSQREAARRLGVGCASVCLWVKKAKAAADGAK